MMVQVKLNAERYFKYAVSEFKEDPIGPAVAIRMRTVPSITGPSKPKLGSSEVDVIIWKDDYLPGIQDERENLGTDQPQNLQLGAWSVHP